MLKSLFISPNKSYMLETDVQMRMELPFFFVIHTENFCFVFVFFYYHSVKRSIKLKKLYVWTNWRKMHCESGKCLHLYLNQVQS